MTRRHEDTEARVYEDTEVLRQDTEVLRQDKDCGPVRLSDTDCQPFCFWASRTNDERTFCKYLEWFTQEPRHVLKTLKTWRPVMEKV